MAKETGRIKRLFTRVADTEREEQLRARQEAGIQGLREGEELMNTAIFSRVQIDAALKARSLADGGEPIPAEPEAELLLEEITTELPVHGADRRPTKQPPADPVEVAALEREMMTAKERDEVAELALRVATYYAKSAAIFVVNNGIVAGLQSAGDGNNAGIEAVMIPADAESVICRPIATGKVCRGILPLGEVDARVLKAMGRTDAKEVLVLPVPIGERVVNLLYVDNGAETLADTSVGALRVLALGVAKAYERLVLERSS
jgi:hypothetical protein